jgi:hypothetical protein
MVSTLIDSPHQSVPSSARARGKRPRPSGENDFDQPKTAIRRVTVDITTTASPRTTKGMSSHGARDYKKGMYLDFIRDAFSEREKVSEFLFFFFFGRNCDGGEGRQTAWMVLLQDIV